MSGSYAILLFKASDFTSYYPEEKCCSNFMVSVSKQPLKILGSSVKPEETKIYRVQVEIYVNPLKPVNLINIIPHYQATSLAFTINLINVLKIKRSFRMDIASKIYFKDVVS